MLQTIRKWLGFETYEPEEEYDLGFEVFIAIFGSSVTRSTSKRIQEVILEHFDEQRAENGVVYLSEDEQNELFDKIDTRVQEVIEPFEQ